MTLLETYISSQNVVISLKIYKMRHFVVSLEDILRSYLPLQPAIAKF